MNVTPDGQRYVMASTQRVARPFHYRWLVPKLCKNDALRWRYMTAASLAACDVLIYCYAGGGLRGVAASLMALGFAGVFKFNWKHPVLVDAPGMACALGSAVAFQHGVGTLGIALALLGGCVRETSPVFAALYAWNPLALIGVLPVAVRHLQREGPDVLDPGNRWVLDHPFRASQQFHLGKRWRNDLPVQTLPCAAYVLPWGGALVAVAHPSAQFVCTVAVAYALVAVATDTMRLYQWSWPVVVLCAVHAVPLSWLPLLVILTIANPFQGDGG